MGGVILTRELLLRTDAKVHKTSAYQVQTRGKFKYDSVDEP